MASKYKKITINVSNDELDALEDICTVDFREDNEKTTRKALKIWERLVKEFDKSKKKV